MADRYVGEYGQVFSVTATGIASFSGATVQIRWIKPSGAELLVTATVDTLTASHTWVAGQLNESGTWSGELIATFASEVRISDRFARPVVGERV